MKICVYTENFKQDWDDFISKSKNGTFLFFRDYMEYHSDRFKDFSLLFYDDKGLIAVMPANREGDKIVSHAGLTYGGIVSDSRMKTPTMLEIFETLKQFLRKQGATELEYKVIPHIYHEIPAEEDLYALFIHNAWLIRRDVSSTIFMSQKVSFRKSRKWRINRSKKSGLELKNDNNFNAFMAIEEDSLRRKYGVKPVHSADELQLLTDRFPENIKLFTAYRGGTMVAGIVIYETHNVAHAQYTAATDLGKEVNALDLILDFLINEYYVKKKYFDFGISTEKKGRYLNVGLIENKESFGARTVVYDFYAMNIT